MKVSPELLKEYTDILGRCTVYPSNKDEELKGNYDSNNALLYTGELALLLRHTGMYDFGYQVQHNLAYTKCYADKGLLSRHPEPYRFDPEMRPVSMDEYRGFFMAASVNPQLKAMAKEIVEYGKANHWNFTDQPGEYGKGRSLLSLLIRPVETFRQFRAYQDKAKSIGTSNGGYRKAAQYFTYLNPLFFYTQLDNRMFYKAVAGSPTSLAERVYFCLSTVLASFKKDDGQNSSRIMQYFMFMALDRVGFNSPLVKLSKVVYTRSCVKLFGDNYTYSMLSKYFSPRHPIALLSEK